jgi:cyclomaltodextrinase
MLFMMCYPGAPCIYYGDEIGMEGNRDPDSRRAFPWDQRRWDTKLRDYVKRCIALRKAYPALRRGEYRTLFAQGDIYAFGRRLKEETLLCVLNVGSKPWGLQLPLQGYVPEGAALEGVWQEGTATVRDGRLVGLELPARSGLVLRAV